MSEPKIVLVQDIRETKSKEEHISDYIKSLKAIEEAMEPYKLSVRALRLLKDDVDIGALIDMYEALKSDEDE